MLRRFWFRVLIDLSFYTKPICNINFHLRASTSAEICASLLHASKESMNYCTLGNVLHMLHFLHMVLRLLSSL